ncbi:MAG: hypothetical protein HYY44_05860 [Deltaproteobacteria bacterium]|nr:hypothetical protein [Deltaproteobacteria bacterium]
MTIPLLLLGLFSLIGGWIGIPGALHGGDHFFRWLAPLFPYSGFYEKLESSGHGVELLLSVVTFLWVFHVSLITLILYSQKPAIVARLAGKVRFLNQVLKDKFYIDELYDLVFLRPINWFSRVVLWRFNDEKVIDGLLVNGSAETVGLLGRTLNQLQTGLVQNYAIYFVLSALGLIAWFVL